MVDKITYLGGFHRGSVAISGRHGGFVVWAGPGVLPGVCEGSRLAPEFPVLFDAGIVVIRGNAGSQ